jgi:pSer/pThr/pTyr-binding forkhead associated (FHA) protein
MERKRVLLHSPLGWRRLSVGSYVLGRGKDCDIVVVSNRASRKHARIVVSETGAVLEDLSSANGTHVNGAPIQSKHPLAHEDFVVIGESGLDIVVEPDVGPSKAPVLEPRGEAPSHQPLPRASSRPEPHATTDATVGHGEGEKAERWIETWAEGVLAQARAGQLTDEQTQRSAMRFGVELGVNRHTPHWIDFALELAALGIPLPLDRAAALSPVIEAHGAGAAALDGWLARLRSLPPSQEREALLVLAESWRAHAR